MSDNKYFKFANIGKKYYNYQLCDKLTATNQSNYDI